MVYICISHAVSLVCEFHVPELFCRVRQWAALHFILVCCIITVDLFLCSFGKTSKLFYTYIVFLLCYRLTYKHAGHTRYDKVLKNTNEFLVQLISYHDDPNRVMKWPWSWVTLAWPARWIWSSSFVNINSASFDNFL